jgi:hypothetical protein
MRRVYEGKVNALTWGDLKATTKAKRGLGNGLLYLKKSA